MFSLIDQQFGNYRLHSLLGRGGVADVYLGEHIVLQTQAAIKVLHTQMTQQELRQFVQEARTVAHFRHEHIIRVLDFGFADEIPFLVMDFAAYGSLRQLHPHGTRLPLATIVSYVRQIASALHYAHQRKMIHRDVKPENILMDAEGSILLGDFGLAIEAHSSRSLSTQAPFGTVRYMAPEQLRGKARAASDQYALAVIVYEWLSGSYPFDGESSITIALQHLMDSPPALRETLPHLAPEIEHVILRALSKEPAQRYETVLDFAAALEAACLPRLRAMLRPRYTTQVTPFPVPPEGDLMLQAPYTDKPEVDLMEAEKTIALDLPLSTLNAQAHDLLAIACSSSSAEITTWESGDVADPGLDYVTSTAC